MNQPLYQIDRLCHRYNGQPVLQIDHLSIPAGGILGVVGPNGSGKSTLLKLLGFMQAPSEGTIRFNGQPAQPFSPAVRFQVTLLTQEPYLMKRSVLKNIAYGLELRGDVADLKARVYEALAWVGLPGDDFARRRWYELSGGEAQRVALAARLVLKPNVLLLDEPTASIDAASVQVVKDGALRAHRAYGATLVIASHDWQWLYETCDDVVHLFKGRLFRSGKNNIVFGPWTPRHDGLYEKKLVDGQAFVVPAPPNPAAVAVIDSQALTILPPAAGSHPSPTALSAVVSSLTLETSTGHILATFRVDTLTLVARLQPQQVHDARLFPGSRAPLRYGLEAVRWC